MQLLVTGAAGFIGFHLARHLVAQGHAVVGLDVLNEYYDVRIKHARLAQLGVAPVPSPGVLTPSATHPNFRFLRRDLTDREALFDLCRTERFEAVCHLAAQAGVRYSLVNPQAYVDSNLTGFLNVLEACRHHEVGHLVYASSSSVYGLNETLPFSTHDPVDHAVSLYAASKKANELMAHTYSHLFRLPTTGLRFFTVYGPWGRPDMALFLFTAAILAGRPLDVFNQGEMRRDFTYVGDVVECIGRIVGRPPAADPTFRPTAPDPATSSAPYRLYNIGNCAPVRLLDFIEAIELELGRPAEKRFLPLQPGDVPATWADVGDLIRDFDYRPATPIREGIRRFIEWYRAYYQV